MELRAEEIVGWWVLAIEAYAALGLLFAVCFVAGGARRVDSQAVGAGWGFRLLILPGVAALWPLLLRRWIAGAPDPPIERNPHR
jgi:hypothetical protein